MSHQGSHSSSHPGGRGAPPQSVDVALSSGVETSASFESGSAALTSMVGIEHPEWALLGLSPVVPDESPKIYEALLRVASRLSAEPKQVFGLLPVGADVGGLALALQIAHVMGGRFDERVAVVDANQRRPAAADVMRAAGRDLGDGFGQLELGAQLALVGALGAGASSADLLLALETRILSLRQTFDRVLVDVTGMRERGDHLAAMTLLDGVMVVARSGKASEGELLRVTGEVSKDKSLGVLLWG